MLQYYDTILDYNIRIQSYNLTIQVFEEAPLPHQNPQALGGDQGDGGDWIQGRILQPSSEAWSIET